MGGYITNFNGGSQIFGIGAKCINSNNTTAYNKRYAIIVSNIGFFLYNMTNSTGVWTLTNDTPFDAGMKISTNLNNEVCGTCMASYGTTANMPVSAGSWCVMTLGGDSTAIRAQILFHVSSLYVRRRDGSGWQAWKTFNAAS